MPKISKSSVKKTTSKVKKTIKKVKKDTDELSLKKLNKALEKAILEEEYENAAEIRDKIKSLEK